MPERWERELRKLRRVEMQEPSVRERIERGPKDQHLPGRERLVAAIVAFAVFGAVGAFAWRALSPAETSGPVFAGPSPETLPSPGPIGAGTVVIDIRRSSEQRGGPEAIARFGAQEQWMCPDGFTVVNPDGTEESVVLDCGQSDAFLAPVGTPITVAGDFATLNGTTRVSGDRVSGSSDVVPALEAGSVLTLGYEVTWDDGSEASFWLLLTVTEENTVQPSDVLRIRCGADGAEILTPDVVAQANGIHIRVDNPSDAAALEFSDVVSPQGVFGGPIDDSGRTWPIYPGDFYVECLARPSDTYRALATARFRVLDPNGYWVPVSPQCPEDALREVRAYDGGAAEYIDDESAIRGTLLSLLPNDQVSVPGYPAYGGAKDLRYVVVRDGRVVAVLYVGLSDDMDPYGSGLTEVTGQACASSGIAQGGTG
jgi:hypothetical protein